MAEEDVVVGHSGAGGDAAHFFDQFRGDKGFEEAGLGEQFPAAESAEAVDGGEVDVDEVADERLEEGAVLAAHFVGGALEVEEAPAAMYGE